MRTLDALKTDPDGPLHQGRFQSSLRDTRLAAWLGASLGILFSVCFLTGLYSHLHQHPVTWFPVPSRPAGLYRVTQGIHVASGIASMPVLIAKLWVVWPRLFAFPPFRRIGDVVERIGVFALVGGGVFMVFTGIANIAQWYPWHFSFTAVHYWVAWIVIGAIVAHMGAKWPITSRALARRRNRPALTEPDAELGTIAERPDPATPVAGLSRRGFLGTVAAASGVLTVVTLGQTFPPLRRFGLLAPRDPTIGSQGHPVNRSARNAGVIDAARSAGWRLTVEGRVDRPLSLTLDEVMALSVHEATLPIACVEGWSYSARWRGVRVGDLLSMAGAPHGATAHVGSLEDHSIYAVSFLDRAQAGDRDTLLATHLDGEPLSLDHGYPLRLIGPGRPGVSQTKWVTRVVVA